MATGGNFNDELTLLGGVVEAKGPLEPDADLKEICVWVVQQQAKGHDVAFTEMTTTMENRDADFRIDGAIGTAGRTWTLNVGPIPNEPGTLAAGPALAMAIALMADGDAESAPRKTLQWAQAVWLVEPAA